MNAPTMATLTVLALAAAIAPLPAPAAGAGSTSYDFTTREFDPMTAGEFDGRLRLHVTPDGIVNGTFMTSEGHISTVVGGLTGTKIWLQVGDRFPFGRRTFNGILSGKKLTATAQGTGLHTWTLEGTPAGP